MTSSKVIELIFAALEIASNAILLAQSMKLLVAPSDQFVRIGLMTDIPNYLITFKV
jgi:hypothetical protein